MGSKSWIFVVDTNKYSGNFEREMCAYMTGVVGECGVGAEAAKKYCDESSSPPYDWLEHRADDENGCRRPVAIWPTPGWYNDGHGKHIPGDPNVKGRFLAYQSVAIFMERMPTPEEIEFLKERAKKFIKSDHSRFGLEKGIKITGFRMIEESTICSQKDVWLT